MSVGDSGGVVTGGGDRRSVSRMNWGRADAACRLKGYAWMPEQGVSGQMRSLGAGWERCGSWIELAAFAAGQGRLLTSEEDRDARA